VAYFYPNDSDSAACAPLLLDRRLRSREVILSNMRKASSLTLRILKSLYPRADLDVAGDDFAATCSKDETHKLVEDSIVMATWVIEMLPVDMSYV
jgi:hypothetical protein